MSRKPQRRNGQRRKAPGANAAAKRKAAATPREEREPVDDDVMAALRGLATGDFDGADAALRPCSSANASKSPRKRKPHKRKSDKTEFCEMRIDELYASPENDELYGPFDRNNADDAELAGDIAANGVRQPIDVSCDGYVISGHRRLAAARLAGLKLVPCRVHDIWYLDTPTDEWIKLLRDFNRQREKSHDEQLREKLVDIDPDDAHQVLIDHRRRQSQVSVAKFTIAGVKRRKAVSRAKRFFVDAIVTVLDGRRRFWPLSDRQIHYALLNDPPLRHASKPSSTYANDERSYKNLTDLLTRLRLNGTIPMASIADETRPVTVLTSFSTPAPFVARDLELFLKGYYRNLQQSQPHHIEIIGEKNTIASIVKPIADHFCLPLTIGRGYCSLPPRAAMAERYRASGKDKLVLLILSDFDPDGEEICQSFVRSMRDDFSIDNDHPVKVALTHEQVVEYGLPLLVTWYATGNNVAIGADTSRRTLHTRLETPLEKPEERTDFRHRDLLGYVQSHRAELAVACCTILKAYMDAGMPDQGLREWGSFEKWSRLVRGAIVWAGQADPGETRVEFAERSDLEANALKALLAAWEQLDPEGNGLTAAHALRTLDEFPDRYAMAREVFVDQFAHGRAKPASTRSIGKRLSSFRRRVIGGRMFDCKPDRNGVQEWFVVTDSAGFDGYCGVSPNPPRATLESVVNTEVCNTYAPGEGLKQTPHNPANPATPETEAAGECDHEPHERTTFDGFIRSECRKCGKVLTLDRKAEAVGT